jgi:G3E family GTPase
VADLIGTSDTRIPVTVVTGFLGAGKTTLLNRLLPDLSGQKFAVIVNEFGDIGIDGDLIETGEEELIELSSGCICCVVRGDLIRTLRTLLTEKPDLDGIIIETTGLANPGPVIQTLVIDQVIGAQCRLDSVLCVVDAAHILDQLTDGQDANGQDANGQDANGQDANGQDANGQDANGQDANGQDAADQIAFSDHIVLNKINDAAGSIADIESRLRQLNPFAPITRANRSDVPAVAILNQHGFDLDRIEAQIVSDPEDLESDHHHHDHIDRSGITSVSLTSDAALDATSLEDWLQELLARHGNNILRTKGILSIEGEDRKLVLQAVNMMLEGDYIGAWGNETRSSRLVFIGRHLAYDELKSGFQACRSRISAYAE